jgi:5'-methylthioadenosine phosphorylase
VLTAAIKALPDPDGCGCDTWADGLDLAYEIPVR